jgi:hypothetical protein
MSLRYAHGSLLLHAWTPAQIPETGTSLIGTQVSFFNSNANWDQNGDDTGPKNLLAQNLVTDLNFNYQWIDAWTLFGRMSLSGIQGQNSLNSNGKIDAPTGARFGWGDQTVGIQHRLLLFNRINLQSQFQIDFPLYSAESHFPSLGDGSIDWTGGGFLNYPLSLGLKTELEVLIGAGITYRTHFYSAAIPWFLGLRINSSHSQIYIQGSLQGSTSMKSDPHSYSPTFFRENLGHKNSLFTGAMNPSWTHGQILLGYQDRTHFHLTLSLTQSLWGQMTPQLTSLTIQLELPLQNDKKTPWTAQHTTTQPHLATESTRALPQDTELPTTVAKIIKINERLNLIKINQGEEDGIQIGDSFQLFSPLDPTQKPLAIARAVHVRPHQSALEISEYIENHWISEDYLANKVLPTECQKNGMTTLSSPNTNPPLESKKTIIN